MRTFSESFRNDFWTIVIGALIFLVSFLWKDLITDIEELYFPKAGGISSRVAFIAIITVAIIVLVAFIRNTVKLENRNIQFDDGPVGDDGGGGAD